jgi:uncharacterized protein
MVIQMPQKFVASDVRAWQHCHRRVWYDHNPPDGFVVEEDRFEELIKYFGELHENGVKERLGVMVEAKDAEHTRQLIEDRTPAIYQPKFVDEEIGLEGRPDFLLLQDDGVYQVADAKFAKSLKKHPEIGIQIALYRMLARSDPDALVYLGNGETETVGDKANKNRDAFLSSIRDILSQGGPPDVHFGESKCGECPYDIVCRPGFIESDALTLVYGLDARSVPGLVEQGIDTMTKLASADPSAIRDVPYLKGEKKGRAVLQAQSQVSGEIRFIERPNLPDGTWVHFDIETNPLSTQFDEEVYLWGFLTPPYEKNNFEHVWSSSGPNEDRRAWDEFLGFVRKYRDAYEKLTLVHFHSFELTKIKLYASRYEMEDDPTVAWLLGDESPLFDLLPAVRNSIALPLTGYGLKKICKHENLVNFQWELPESGSQWSMVRYNDFLVASDAGEKADIANEIRAYNRDDVRATRALETWLRDL